MSTHPDLVDYLKSQTDKFANKTKFFVFGHLEYKSTSEKVKSGFRYFDCDIGQLQALFERRDFEAIAKLPFSLDEDGDPDTSSVCLKLAYAPSGAFVAAQVEEYQDGKPVNLTPTLLIEGATAKSAVSAFKTLDQAS